MRIHFHLGCRTIEHRGIIKRLDRAGHRLIAGPALLCFANPLLDALGFLLSDHWPDVGLLLQWIANLDFFSAGNQQCLKLLSATCLSTKMRCTLMQIWPECAKAPSAQRSAASARLASAATITGELLPSSKVTFLIPACDRI